MTQIVKHRGTIPATGSRCIVVFRELPDDPNHALVCYTDSIPEAYAISLARVVDGHAAQSTKDLHEVLTREFTSDGRDFLTTLHLLGRLHKIRTSEVEMHPTPSYKIRLDLLNEQINGTAFENEQTVEDLQKKANPYAEASKAQDANDALGIAQRLLMEAEDFEGEANNKRERAYSLRPELRPEETNTSEITEEVTSSGTFSINLQGVTQREAVRLLQEEWRKVNKKESEVTDDTTVDDTNIDTSGVNE